ncbi:MAG: hypothetical protein AAGJ18_21000 [Bacteroidota bacterium]
MEKDKGLSKGSSKPEGCLTKYFIHSTNNIKMEEIKTFAKHIGASTLEQLKEVQRIAKETGVPLEMVAQFYQLNLEYAGEDQSSPLDEMVRTMQPMIHQWFEENMPTTNKGARVVLTENPDSFELLPISIGDKVKLKAGGDEFLAKVIAVSVNKENHFLAKKIIGDNTHIAFSVSHVFDYEPA